MDIVVFWEVQISSNMWVQKFGSFVDNLLNPFLTAFVRFGLRKTPHDNLYVSLFPNYKIFASTLEEIYVNAKSSESVWICGQIQIIGLGELEFCICFSMSLP